MTTTDTQYGSLREKIAAETAERKQRYAAFAELWAKAQEAGREAAETAVPQPMVVYEADGLTDNPKPGGNAWYVSEGVCGFGWVESYPGNTSFANWAKKNAGWRKSYGGGVQFWVSAYGQSYERKTAYARAAAAVLSEGLKDLDPRVKGVYGTGRLD